MALFNIGGTISPTELQTYSAAFVYLNNQVLFEETSVTVSTATTSKQVNTVGNAYSGEALGIATSTITIDSNIPAAGLEFEPTQFLVTGTPLNFITNIGGSNFEFNGTIINSSFSHAVDSLAKINFQARGKFVELTD